MSTFRANENLDAVLATRRAFAGFIAAYSSTTSRCKQPPHWYSILGNHNHSLLCQTRLASEDYAALLLTANFVTIVAGRLQINPKGWRNFMSDQHFGPEELVN